MKKIILLLFLFLIYNYSSAQTDSLAKSKASFIPALKLDGNYVVFFDVEMGFFFEMTRKNLHKPSTPLSTMCHGSLLSCKIGDWNGGNFAPKFSYEYYSVSYGTKVLLIDYMHNGRHNLYISPEAGLSFGAALNLFLPDQISLFPEKLMKQKHSGHRLSSICSPIISKRNSQLHLYFLCSA